MYEKLLPISERTDLSKMGLFSFVNNGNVEQYVSLSQYLKAIYVIEKFEQESTKPKYNIWTGSNCTSLYSSESTQISQSMFHYTSSISCYTSSRI